MATQQFAKRIDDFEKGKGKSTRGGLNTERFGEEIPFCEPYWCEYTDLLLGFMFVLSAKRNLPLTVFTDQGYHSPYYKDTHKAFRAKVRSFIENEVKPNVDEWMDKSRHPHCV